jgi:hypothetical protein
MLADGGLRQMHALGGAREALDLATATKAAQFGPRLLPHRWAFIKIVASSLAPAHPSLASLRFARSAADRIDPIDEAFFPESEWIRREIHFDGFAI